MPVKTILWFNKVTNTAGDVFDVLRPALSAWCNEFGYYLPSDIGDLNLCVASNRAMGCENIGFRGAFDESAVPGGGLVVIEEYSWDVTVWVHEFAHYIQWYNLGEDFTSEYAEEDDSYGYHDNRFELEAQCAGELAYDMVDAGLILWAWASEQGMLAPGNS